MHGINLFSSYTREINAQLTAAAQVAARKQDEADAVALKQIDDLRSALPTELPAALKAALPPKVAPRAANADAPNYTPLVVGGGLAALGLLLLLQR